MIEIKPAQVTLNSICKCGSKDLIFGEIIWQGQHVCVDITCKNCNKNFLQNIPTGQSLLETRIVEKDTKSVYKLDWQPSKDAWLNKPLSSILTPVKDDISLNIQVNTHNKKIIILNCLEFVYGHAVLVLFNLQRIIKLNSNSTLGIVVIIQPMFKWMLPQEGIAEIWTVNASFKQMTYYNEYLNMAIHKELQRFEQVFLSHGHLIPTNTPINIQEFTKIPPFNFDIPPTRPRITFIWRQDPGRLWIRNIYILKGFEKLGLKKILLPFHYLRIVTLFFFLKKEFGNRFIYTVAGFGKWMLFPKFITDARTNDFNDDTERFLCQIYSESELIIGVHGSSMILPSAHAGMCISLMPSKRWGNFAEDILFSPSETDVRLAAFQKRIIPINLCIFDIIDICINMLKGRMYFLKKFKHSNEL
ncbi:hypothetical protein [Runella zeae]|uniref:hypothetical protein n=1 Tax=Runella zeae TaxID=94255 RepID=UPI0004210238|nr:hypothetical protein [Runella zeae]